jgi:competence CoiA-like predicted nuclease
MNCIKLLGAINKDTGKYTPPRFATKNDKYKCPECERDLIFRQGKIKIHHFAHTNIKFYVTSYIPIV